MNGPHNPGAIIRTRSMLGDLEVVRKNLLARSDDLCHPRRKEFLGTSQRATGL